MNVYPFRKRPRAGGQSGKIWQEDFLLGTNTLLKPSLPPPLSKDDFNQEIEVTRTNPALIAVLRSRAGEPAVISLQDVKRRFELDF